MVGGFDVGIVRLRYAPSLRRGPRRGISGSHRLKNVAVIPHHPAAAFPCALLTGLIASAYRTSLTGNHHDVEGLDYAQPLATRRMEIPCRSFRAEVTHLQFLPLGPSTTASMAADCPQGVARRRSKPCDFGLQTSNALRSRWALLCFDPTSPPC